jgi:magnesium-transporting ATPase (P-type)
MGVLGIPKIKRRTILRKKGIRINSTLDLIEPPLPMLFTLMAVCNKATIEKNIDEEYSWHENSFFEDSAYESVGVDELGQLELDLELDFYARNNCRLRYKFNGSPCDVALLRYCESLLSSDQLRSEYSIVFEIPFNSVRKWHLVIVKRVGASPRLGNNSFILMMKGASEVLFTRCTTYATESGETDIDEDFQYNFQVSREKEIAMICARDGAGPLWLN